MVTKLRAGEGGGRGKRGEGGYVRGEAAKRETRQRKIGQVISNERGYFTARGRRTVIRTRRFSMGIIPAMIPSSPPLFFPPSSRITEFHRETGYRGSVAFNAESLPLSPPLCSSFFPLFFEYFQRGINNTFRSSCRPCFRINYLLEKKMEDNR